MGDPQVLIIDDDKDSAGYFGAVLNIMQYEVEIVLSAKEALARLSSLVPDLIILDMRLGVEIGGEDILYQVRSNPRFDNTRVIVVTGYPNTVDMVANLADLILIKPVAMDLLQTLVARISSFSFKPKRMPFRDPVTDLFNKDFFFTRLELAYERAKRRNDFIFAVLVFKAEASEAEGIPVSTEVSLSILRKIAERLKTHLRPTDSIARISGWKFATLHEDLSKGEDVTVIIERVKQLLVEPIEVGEDQYQVKVNFGAVVNSPRYQQPVDLYDAAEQALVSSEIPE